MKSDFHAELIIMSTFVGKHLVCFFLNRDGGILPSSLPNTPATLSWVISSAVITNHTYTHRTLRFSNWYSTLKCKTAVRSSKFGTKGVAVVTGMGEGGGRRWGGGGAS